MEARYPTTGRLLMLANAEAKKEAAKAASMCEGRLRFDPVPIYSVTLAEDVDASFSTYYVVPLGDHEPEALLITIETGAEPSAANLYVRYSWDNLPMSMVGIPNGVRTQASFATMLIYKFCGIPRAVLSSRIASSSVPGGAAVNVDQPYVVEDNAVITACELLSGSAKFFAGTKIAVYAALPDQRVTDVFGTELEEVTSEQIHSLFI